MLKLNTTYTWRARAGFGGVLGSWSQHVVTFQNAGASASSVRQSWAGILRGQHAVRRLLQCVAAAYPEKLVKTSDGDFSDERREENMAFIRDRIIETGRCKGMDLGRNFKRGTPVISHDFIVWRRPGHRTAGVDIARGYDNNRERLQLGWQVWGAPSYGHPYLRAATTCRSPVP